MLHARSAARADETRKKISGAEDIVVGDLASIAETKSVADEVDKLGRFDAVIHNAGIGYREAEAGEDGGRPASTLRREHSRSVHPNRPHQDAKATGVPISGMHYGAGSHLDDMLWEKRRWNGSQAYAETKFQNVLLAFAVARLFPG